MIFLIVEGTLIWSLVKYRGRRAGPEAAQIRGNTPLELGWTVGAALILVVLTVVTFLYLDDIENPPPSGPNGLQASQARFASIDQPDPPASGGPILRIEVNGQQYLWRYDYPGDQTLFSYHEMVVPMDTTVVLEVTASDVIHSWWIPKLGGKVDAVPGHVNETWFKIPAKFAGDSFEAGTVFDGQCAELCGASHADMRAAVRAVTPESTRRGPSSSATTSRRPARRSPSSAKRARRARRASSSGSRHGNRCPGRPPEIVMHGLKPEPRGWLVWLTTTDHKKIGILYLFATFLFFILGGVEALIMRLQLAQPRHAGRRPRPTTGS